MRFVSPRRRSGALLIAATMVTVAARPAAAQDPKSAGPVVLRAARLIDGTGAPALTNAVIVVSGDSIIAVGREGSVPIPPNARLGHKFRRALGQPARQCFEGRAFRVQIKL